MQKTTNQTLIKYYKRIEDLKVAYLYLQELLLETKIERNQVLDEIADGEQKLRLLCLASNTTLDELHKNYTAEYDYREE